MTTIAMKTTTIATMKTKTKRRAAKRSQCAKRALKHAARLSPDQLAGLLAARTERRPERLAALACQLSQIACAYIERKELRRELRQRRAQPQSPPPAEVLQQALAHESQRRSREHIAVSLALSGFPVEWGDSFATTASDPQQVALALLGALGRVQ